MRFLSIITVGLAIASAAFAGNYWTATNWTNPYGPGNTNPWMVPSAIPGYECYAYCFDVGPEGPSKCGMITTTCMPFEQDGGLDDVR